MVDYKKLNKDLLNELIKAEEKHTKFDYYLSEGINSENEVGIMAQHYGVFIHKGLLFIDFKDKVSPTPLNIKPFKDGFNETKEIKLTSELVQVDKLILKVFQFEDGSRMYANSKLFEYFGKDLNSYTFYAKNRISPIYIKDGNYIIGLVLPVNHKES